MRCFRFVAAFALSMLAGVASAAYQTWTISQIYSNADGSIQFVVLIESSNANGENLLGGHTLTMTHGGVTKTFMFPADLPSANTAGRSVLIGTPGFADASPVAPDYLMPQRFIATDGGTLDYAGVDAFTYPPLPTDGASAQYRVATHRAESGDELLRNLHVARCDADDRRRVLQRLARSLLHQRARARYRCARLRTHTRLDTNGTRLHGVSEPARCRRRRR